MLTLMSFSNIPWGTVVHAAISIAIIAGAIYSVVSGKRISRRPSQYNDSFFNRNK